MVLGWILIYIYNSESCSSVLLLNKDKNSDIIYSRSNLLYDVIYNVLVFAGGGCNDERLHEHTTEEVTAHC